MSLISFKKVRQTNQFLLQLYTYLRWGLKIDRQAPRGGEIGKAGFVVKTLSEAGIVTLERLWNSSDLYERRQKEKFGGVRLSEEQADALAEIIGAIEDPILAYLGVDAKLDGVSWSESNKEKSKSSISAFWHTDNVGARIKVFVCLNGDGSQPTVIKPSYFNSDFLRIAFDAAMQLMRWIGLGSNLNLPGQIFIRHQRGSIAAFDTDTLHRGSYDLGSGERVIFHLEFSNPEKHSFLNGPIGSSQQNAFLFPASYLNNGVFRSFLDDCRVKVSGTMVHYGQDQLDDDSIKGKRKII